ncbi:MAG: hypothetical protein QM802_22410 [Agriterribacter sp.]
MTRPFIEALLILLSVGVLSLIYLFSFFIRKRHSDEKYSNERLSDTLNKLSSTLDRLSFIENKLFSLEDRLFNLQERQLISYNFKNDFYMPLSNEILNFINDLELRNEIRLSPEAKQLLILPILEYQRLSNDPNIDREINIDSELSNWRDSISKIIDNMRYEPARIDSLKQNRRISERTSLSVIKAFSNRFCNIPPFCGEK